MNIIKKNAVSLTVFFISLALSIFIFLKVFPAEKDLMVTLDIPDKQTDSLFFVAIGDSLTEGVGDSTESGGFVPLLEDMLAEEAKLNVVESANHGKSGDRSDQVFSRIKKSKDIQEDLAKADFITLTVGGNDLMKIIKSDLFSDINFETFKKPKENYQKNLEKLLALIREYNKTAPIYQLGVYNPFYLSFNQITEMQEIVDLWNLTAEESIKSFDDVFFVPINDNIYSGMNTTNENSENGVNNLLSDADNFHPNNLGYQIIANEFKSKLMTTTKLWLEE
ncbi:SGNH/GDSL hydrolase family protein [Vagococcus elongatus]|uniref:SGNH/GDSL hydrolase family protein n=1 Tax=Vagococcus elongatus TaxID=180344 RepID=UPI000F876E29|nr:SGNH/GDSL hydrolase family protein [Vagococcus elongatus]